MSKLNLVPKKMFNVGIVAVALIVIIAIVAYFLLRKKK